LNFFLTVGFATFTLSRFLKYWYVIIDNMVTIDTISNDTRIIKTRLQSENKRSNKRNRIL
jgi:hypothetical protein